MTSPWRDGVPTRRRVAIAIVVALLVGWRCWITSYDPTDPPDFAQVWFAARAILHGQNPYQLIGPELAFDFPFRFFYPLTAAVAVTPLAGLPLRAACTVFAALGGGGLAWTLMRYGYAPLLGLLGGGMVIASQEAQWSPVFAASFGIPALGLLYAAKPTIGLAMFVAKPSWWPIIGAVVLVPLAFVALPHWPLDWYGTVHIQRPAIGGSAFIVPLRLAFGPLVLIALTRWRRPEARLLVALACVPQSVGLYESVPLLLIPRTWGESAYLLVASHVVLQWAIAHGGLPDFDRLTAVGHASVLLMYLPCVLMVLRRPNEGSVPAWLEARLTGWPMWLRGAHPKAPAC